MTEENQQNPNPESTPAPETQSAPAEEEPKKQEDSPAENPGENEKPAGKKIDPGNMTVEVVMEELMLKVADAGDDIERIRAHYENCDSKKLDWKEIRANLKLAYREVENAVFRISVAKEELRKIEK